MERLEQPFDLVRRYAGSAVRDLDLWALLGGFASTLVIGGVAGLYPAVRASRLSPTDALATP